MEDKKNPLQELYKQIAREKNNSWVIPVTPQNQHLFSEDIPEAEQSSGILSETLKTIPRASLHILKGIGDIGYSALTAPIAIADTFGYAIPALEKVRSLYDTSGIKEVLYPTYDIKEEIAQSPSPSVLDKFVSGIQRDPQFIQNYPIYSSLLGSIEGASPLLLDLVAPHLGAISFVASTFADSQKVGTHKGMSEAEASLRALAPSAFEAGMFKAMNVAGKLAKNIFKSPESSKALANSLNSLINKETVKTIGSKALSDTIMFQLMGTGTEGIRRGLGISESQGTASEVINDVLLNLDTLRDSFVSALMFAGIGGYKGYKQVRNFRKILQEAPEGDSPAVNELRKIINQNKELPQAIDKIISKFANLSDEDKKAVISSLLNSPDNDIKKRLTGLSFLNMYANLDKNLGEDIASALRYKMLSKILKNEPIDFNKPLKSLLLEDSVMNDVSIPKDMLSPKEPPVQAPRTIKEEALSEIRNRNIPRLTEADLLNIGSSNKDVNLHFINIDSGIIPVIGTGKKQKALDFLIIPEKYEFFDNNGNPQIGSGYRIMYLGEGTNKLDNAFAKTPAELVSMIKNEYLFRPKTVFEYPKISQIELLNLQSSNDKINLSFKESGDLLFPAVKIGNNDKLLDFVIKKEPVTVTNEDGSTRTTTGFRLLFTGEGDHTLDNRLFTNVKDIKEAILMDYFGRYPKGKGIPEKQKYKEPEKEEIIKDKETIQDKEEAIQDKETIQGKETRQETYETIQDKEVKQEKEETIQDKETRQDTTGIPPETTLFSDFGTKQEGKKFTDTGTKPETKQDYPIDIWRKPETPEPVITKEQKKTTEQLGTTELAIPEAKQKTALPVLPEAKSSLPVKPKSAIPLEAPTKPEVTVEQPIKEEKPKPSMKKEPPSKTKVLNTLSELQNIKDKQDITKEDVLKAKSIINNLFPDVTKPKRITKSNVKKFIDDTLTQVEQVDITKKSLLSPTKQTSYENLKDVKFVKNANNELFINISYSDKKGTKNIKYEPDRFSYVVNESDTGLKSLQITPTETKPLTSTKKKLTKIVEPETPKEPEVISKPQESEILKEPEVISKPQEPLQEPIIPKSKKENLDTMQQVLSKKQTEVKETPPTKTDIFKTEKLVGSKLMEFKINQRKLSPDLDTQLKRPVFYELPDFWTHPKSKESKQALDKTIAPDVVKLKDTPNVISDVINASKVIVKNKPYLLVNTSEGRTYYEINKNAEIRATRDKNRYILEIRTLPESAYKDLKTKTFAEKPVEISKPEQIVDKTTDKLSKKSKQNFLLNTIYKGSDISLKYNSEINAYEIEVKPKDNRAFLGNKLDVLADIYENSERNNLFEKGVPLDKSILKYEPFKQLIEKEGAFIENKDTLDKDNVAILRLNPDKFNKVAEHIIASEATKMRKEEKETVNNLYDNLNVLVSKLKQEKQTAKIIPEKKEDTFIEFDVKSLSQDQHDKFIKFIKPEKETDKVAGVTPDRIIGGFYSSAEQAKKQIPDILIVTRKENKNVADIYVYDDTGGIPKYVKLIKQYLGEDKEDFDNLVLNNGEFIDTDIQQGKKYFKGDFYRTKDGFYIDPAVIKNALSLSYKETPKPSLLRQNTSIYAEKVKSFWGDFLENVGDIGKYGEYKRIKIHRDPESQYYELIRSKSGSLYGNPRLELFDKANREAVAKFNLLKNTSMEDTFLNNFFADIVSSKSSKSREIPLKEIIEARKYLKETKKHLLPIEKLSEEDVMIASKALNINYSLRIYDNAMKSIIEQLRQHDALDILKEVYKKELAKNLFYQEQYSKNFEEADAILDRMTFTEAKKLLTKYHNLIDAKIKEDKISYKEMVEVVFDAYKDKFFTVESPPNLLGENVYIPLHYKVSTNKLESLFLGDGKLYTLSNQQKKNFVPLADLFLQADGMFNASIKFKDDFERVFEKKINNNWKEIFDLEANRVLKPVALRVEEYQYNYSEQLSKKILNPVIVMYKIVGQNKENGNLYLENLMGGKLFGANKKGIPLTAIKEMGMIIVPIEKVENGDFGRVFLSTNLDIGKGEKKITTKQLNELVSILKKATDVKFYYKDSLPEGIKSSLKERNLLDITEGLSDGKNVLLILDNITPDRLLSVLKHELVHRGLSSVINSESQGMVKYFINKFANENKITNELELQEFLSKKAETLSDLPLFNKIKTALSLSLNKISNRDLALTNDDVSYLIHRLYKEGLKSNTPTKKFTEGSFSFSLNEDLKNKIQSELKNHETVVKEMLKYFEVPHKAPEHSILKDNAIFLRRIIRYIPELDSSNRKDAKVMESIRRIQEVPNGVMNWFEIKMRGLYTDNQGKPISDEQMALASMYVVASDLLRSINQNKYSSGIFLDAEGKELPFKFKNKSEVESFLKETESKLEQGTKEMLARRRKVLNEIFEELKQYYWLPKNLEKISDTENYIRRLIISASAVFNEQLNLGISERLKYKMYGFLRERTGSSLPYLTDIKKADFMYLMQSKALIEYGKIIDNLRLEIDRKDYVKKYIMPKDYKGSWIDFMHKNEVKDPETGERLVLYDLRNVRSPIGSGNLLEDLIESLISSIMDGEKVSKNFEIDMMKLLEQSDKSRYVAIPERYAKVFNNINETKKEGPVGLFFKNLTNLYRKLHTYIPLKVIKWQFYNMFGDLEASLRYPKLLKEVPRAFSDLYDRYLTNKKLPKELEDELIELGFSGTLGTGFFQKELATVGKNRLHNLLFNEEKNDIKNILYNSFEKYKNLMIFRESVLRLSAYRYFKKTLESNPNLKIYGASNPQLIESLRQGSGGNKEVAKILSRDLIGDYGHLSELGKYMRDHLIPFYSFMEVNFRRYYYLLRNSVLENKHNENISDTNKLRNVAVNSIGLLQMALLYTGARVFNNMFFQEEDKKLKQLDPTGQYIIIGRDKQGVIHSVPLQSTILDFLSWLSLDNPQKLYKSHRQLVNGEITFERFIKNVTDTPVSKVLSGVGIFKIPFEMALGKTVFPSIQKGTPIRDKREYLFQQFGFHGPYLALKKHLKEGVVKDNAIASTFIPYKTYDIGELNYINTIKKISEFLKDNGIQKPIIEPTERMNVLHEYKLAKRYKNKELEEKFKKKYFELGGTPQSLMQSKRALHPASFIPIKFRKKFFDSLTDEERQQYKNAVKYWETVLSK